MPVAGCVCVNINTHQKRAPPSNIDDDNVDRSRLDGPDILQQPQHRRGCAVSVTLTSRQVSKKLNACREWLTMI